MNELLSMACFLSNKKNSKKIYLNTCNNIFVSTEQMACQLGIGEKNYIIKNKHIFFIVVYLFRNK